MTLVRLPSRTAASELVKDLQDATQAFWPYLVPIRGIGVDVPSDRVSQQSRDEFCALFAIERCDDERRLHLQVSGFVAGVDCHGVLCPIIMLEQGIERTVVASLCQAPRLQPTQASNGRPRVVDDAGSKMRDAGRPSSVDGKQCRGGG